MGNILHYATTAVAQTCVQLLVVFGIVFALAVLLWFVSQGIRGTVSSRLGMLYYYLVAPGVACHETGHALGCLLTGTKIIKFVPFHPTSDGTLGYVSHEARGGLLGNMALFVISTGPIWFGCALIFGFTCLMNGTGFLPDVQSYFPEGVPPATFGYVSNVFIAAFQVMMKAVAVWNWTSPWIAVYLYVVFCIASEITLSSPDLKSMWKGCAAIAVMFLMVNLIPYAGQWLNGGIVWAKPYLFLVQVVLAFVFMFDVAFLFFAYLILRIFRGRK